MFYLRRISLHHLPTLKFAASMRDSARRSPSELLSSPFWTPKPRFEAECHWPQAESYEDPASPSFIVAMLGSEGECCKVRDSCHSTPSLDLVVPKAKVDR